MQNLTAIEACRGYLSEYFKLYNSKNDNKNKTEKNKNNKLNKINKGDNDTESKSKNNNKKNNNSNNNNLLTRSFKALLTLATTTHLSICNENDDDDDITNTNKGIIGRKKKGCNEDATKRGAAESAEGGEKRGRLVRSWQESVRVAALLWQQMQEEQMAENFEEFYVVLVIG